MTDVDGRDVCGVSIGNDLRDGIIASLRKRDTVGLAVGGGDGGSSSPNSNITSGAGR